jgi:hypothetical protein
MGFNSSAPGSVAVATYGKQTRNLRLRCEGLHPMKRCNGAARIASPFRLRFV